MWRGCRYWVGVGVFVCHWLIVLLQFGRWIFIDSDSDSDSDSNSAVGPETLAWLVYLESCVMLSICMTSTHVPPTCTIAAVAFTHCVSASLLGPAIGYLNYRVVETFASTAVFVFLLWSRPTSMPAQEPAQDGPDAEANRPRPVRPAREAESPDPENHRPRPLRAAGEEESRNLSFASRTILVSGLRPSSPCKEPCSICLVPDEELDLDLEGDGVQLRSRCPTWYRLRCGHRFHQVCVVQWFATTTKPSCPVCREVIVIP